MRFAVLMQFPFPDFADEKRPTAERAREAIPRPAPTIGWLLLDGVLDLLAGLLEVASDALALPLAFEVLVIGRPTRGFLGGTLHGLGSVLGLVLQRHVTLLCRVGGVIPDRWRTQSAQRSWRNLLTRG